MDRKRRLEYRGEASKRPCYAYDSPSSSSQASEADGEIVYATDYSNITSFTTWSENTSFELIKGESAGKVVKVVLESVGDFGDCNELKLCGACKGKLENANLMDSLQALNWKNVDDIDLRRVDEGLQLLASSVKAALKNSFSNGHCKSIVNQICYMIQTYTLCPEHKLRVHCYSPKSGEPGGLNVSIRCHRTISPPSLDSSDGSKASTDDLIMLKGDPDLVVVSQTNPEIVFILGENKKNAPIRDSQSELGQLLFYVIGTYLSRLQTQSELPSPMLGLFMSGPMMQPITSKVEKLQGGYVIHLSCNQPLHIGDDGIFRSVKMAHNYFSMT